MQRCAMPCDVAFATLVPLATPLPLARLSLTPRGMSVLGTSRRRRANLNLLMLAGSNSPRTRPITSRVAATALRFLIKSLCTAADDLSVDIDATSNRALLSGNLRAVSVTASRISFNTFTFSAGAALYTDEISISTTYPGTIIAAPPRLLKPFSVSVRASLTEADLNRPGSMRDALEALLKQIVATGLSGAVGRVLPPDIGGVSCVLDSVELEDAASNGRRAWRLNGQLPSQRAGGKLVLHAHATLSSGQVLRFAVRTGLCSVRDGRVLKMSDPELVWRGFRLPMITIDTIGVELDESARLTKVDIANGVLSGDGIVVISPPQDSPRRFDFMQRRSTDAVTARLEAVRRRGSTHQRGD